MSMQRNNNKKGITFAELMISLVVISVIAAVLYPTIAQFTPNSNKPLFKAAYSTLSSVLFEITNSIPSGKLVNYSINGDGKISATPLLDLCEEFCGVANVLPEKKRQSDDSFIIITDCPGLCADDNIITTSNGMRWKFDEFAVAGYDAPYHRIDGVTEDIKNVFRVVVDVNAANNSLKPAVTSNILSSDIENGVFYFEPNATSSGVYYFDSGVDNSLPTSTSPHGVFNPSRIKMQDTFIFLVDDEGKIVAMSPAGSAHLEDSLQSPD